MKKISLFLAMLALMLVLGLTLVSCNNDSTGGGGGGIPAALVAKWYSTQVRADAGGSD